MGVKQCEKCSEMVEEAKAFCPGCGNSFVTEAKRETASNFDNLAGTVQLGDTMYNQMLTDMGLNLSDIPEVSKMVDKTVAPTQPAAPRHENAVESLQPEVKPPDVIVAPVQSELRPREVVVTPVQPAVNPSEIVISPVPATKPPEVKVAGAERPEQSKPSYIVWILLGAVTVVALFLLIALVAVLIFEYYSRFR